MKWRSFGLQMTLACLTILTTLSTTAQAAVVQVGRGAYNDALPAGRVGPQDNTGNNINPNVVTGFDQPIVTNKWWSSLMMKKYPTDTWTSNMFALPLAYQGVARGLTLGYPSTFYVTNPVTQSGGYSSQESHYVFAKDLTVGINGLTVSYPQVESYSDWTVNAVWAANNRRLVATLGSGLPFVYFTATGDNVQIQTGATPTIWYNQGGVLGVTIGRNHYGIFAPSGSTWTNSGGTLSSSLNNKTYLSVAALPDNTAATLEFYRRHAYAFITSTSVTWEYNEETSQMESTYTAQTQLMEAGNNNVNRPLLALFRHQWLNTNDTLTNYTYVSARGTMKVADASSFSTTMTFHGTLPHLPNVAVDGEKGYVRQTLYNYIDTTFRQTPTARWSGITSADTYWYGKAFGKIAQLTYIADQVGHTAARDLFLQEMKQRLGSWFTGQGAQLFYYSNNWDTLIGYPASYGSDFNLNDHHFHYGYFIQAAACVAHFDPTWSAGENYGGIVNLLIKDVSNWDKNDKQFPFLRSYDSYSGHGWADGSASVASTNNQESSSESMNYSSALILWGSLTGNQQIRDLGIHLYTTETAAIQQYWFDVDEEVFPAAYNPPAAAILWSDGIAYATFFPITAEGVHGINFLPITPASVYLGLTPAYLKKNQDYMYAQPGVNGTWRDIHMAVRALYDPAAAVAQFNSNPNYTPEDGESRAHTYHWIHNFNQLGQVATSVTADHTHYGVFSNNGVLTHVAYNPTASPITVRFSNGTVLNVPAKSTIASQNSNGEPQDPEVAILQEVGNLCNGTADFWFTSNPAASSVSLKYSVNGGATSTVQLTLNGTTYFYSLTGLKNDDALAYSYVFVVNGKTITTSQYQHTYKSPDGSTTPPPSTTPPSSSSKFIQLVQQNYLGQLTFNFIPFGTATAVSVNYSINGGAIQTTNLTENEGNWTRAITGLSGGNTVVYTFTYVIGGQTLTSGSFTYNYVGASGDFSYSVTPGTGSVAIGVVPTKATLFVDLRYRINNGGQLAHRMTNSNGTWRHTIPNVKAGDQITFSFAYEYNGLTRVSDSYTYTYGSN